MTDYRPSLPTVAEIIGTIRADPRGVEQCVHVHRDRHPEMLPEVWIDSLGLWVRMDGTSYSGDLGRGRAYTGWFEGWRLRRALRRWEKEMTK